MSSQFEDALLCEPGNVREFATNISLLLSDKELANQIGKRGQTLAKEIFGVRHNVAPVIKVMKEKGLARNSCVGG